MYKEKKCFLRKFFIIVGLLFVPFFIILKSNNVSAASFDYSYFRLYYNTINNASFVASGQRTYTDPPISGIHAIRAINSAVSNVSVPTNANYLSINSKFNMVVFTDADRESFLPVPNTRYLDVIALSINGQAYDFESSNIDVYQTTWNCNISGLNKLCRTYTFNVSFIVKNIPSSINTLVYGIGSTVPTEGFLFTGYSLGMYAYFEYDYNNFANIEFAFDYSTAIQQQQVQLQQTIINQNQQYYNYEYQAEENISNQNSSDISDAENQTTSNLIGILSSFLTEVSSFQATSCNLDLPFPNFMGGTHTVNICQGRDIFGNFISVISSLALIGFYIPLAIVLIKMIYNEIRSWTNG